LEEGEMAVALPASMAVPFGDQDFRGMAESAEVLSGYHLSGRYHRWVP